jgi:hemerythrin-like domain-containing protein
MDEITQGFTADHHRCDDSFVALEQALSQSNWDAARQAGERFLTAMSHHFLVEEEQLFPALGGFAAGPVQVMRMEHTQMRQLFSQLADGLTRGDQSACLDVTETLLMIMRQHNMKEEHILYPMADQSLDDRRIGILASLRQD